MKEKCEIIGPQGQKATPPSYTTKKGYESGRTQGMRSTYKETGKPGKGSK